MMNTSACDLKAQQGFNLIELMLAMSIVAILASLAVMTFEEYTIRSKVKEGIDMMAPAKQAVADYYASKSALPSSNAMAGIPGAASFAGNYTESVEISGNGVVTVTFNSVNLKLAAKTLIYKPATTAGSVKWDCKFGTLTSKFRPSECR